MTLIGTGIPNPQPEAPVEPSPVSCPRCKHRAVIRPVCPCFMRKKGWVKCAKCTHPKCAHVFGLAKRRKA